MSRLLAALDGGEPESLQMNNPKRGLESGGPSGSGLSAGFKRRATGLGVRAGSQIPAARGHGSAGMSSLVGSQPIFEDVSDDSDTQSRPKSSQRIHANFSLRYDNESTVNRLDRGGQDQAVRMAQFVTSTLDNASHGITVKDALKYLGLEDQKDLLPGMEVRLLRHQAIGVSWMLKQERETRHRGGILADDMGLGKTVQMIATMAMNMPGEDEEHRTTLIVVPAALMLQWKEEIENKTNGLFSVHIHHGKDKLKRADQIERKDVIVTTYQTLNLDFPDPDNLDEDDDLERILNRSGPLARTRWYRVITDEAQFIRNRGTRSSKSCAMIRAKYRWCLTGTPVTNTLADLYGLLRFGRWRPWNDWQAFDEHVAKTQLEDAVLAGQRAQEILKPLLLRRTKDAELEGEPLLELPPKEIEIVRLNFSADERQLYDHIEKKAQIQINRYLRGGRVVKNTSAVLVLILRLRQLCGHPNLVLDGDDHADPSLTLATGAEKELARAKKVMGVRWALEVKRRFLELSKLALEDYDDEELEADPGSCPVCDEPFVNDNGLVLSCGHDVCSDCCRELATAPIAHDGIFVEADEQTNLQAERDFENAAAKGLRPCPTCKKMCDLRPSAVFRVTAFLPSEEELQAATRRKYTGTERREQARAKASMKGRAPAPAPASKDFPMELSDSSEDELPDAAAIIKRAGQAKNAPVNGKAKGRARPTDDDEVTDITMADISGPPKGAVPSKDIFATWAHGGANVEPSAKMLALVSFLKEWDASGDKTICFSQWTSMLDLVEAVFIRNGVQSLRYDGSMNREAREHVLARFRRPGGPRVILISTKCGGVGLNLTSANRIVNLDLSWNYASESQAYDRVHRLGQEKDVFVKRLVVNDTLEERMLKLQETKTGLAEAALGEGGGGKLHKLSVRELKALFGMNQNNEPDPRQSTITF